VSSIEPEFKSFRSRRVRDTRKSKIIQLKARLRPSTAEGENLEGKSTPEG
jgi:hypothetical protein